MNDTSRSPQSHACPGANSTLFATPTSVPVRIQSSNRRFRNGLSPAGHQRTCVIFTAPFRHARHVQLIAEFTGWSRAPIDMSRNGTGFWFAATHLPPGSHRYAYLVDGEHRVDPEAPILHSITGVTSNVCRVTAW